MYWTEHLDNELRRLHGSMSLKEISTILGKTTGSLRGRITVLGIAKKRSWTQDEENELIAVYSKADENGLLNLNDLAKRLGRDKSNVCRKAKTLGLKTSYSRKKVETPKIRKRKFKSDDELSKYKSEAIKERFKKNGHPKGMLGKKHSKETLEKISAAAKAMNASRTDEMKVAINIKAAKTKIENGTYTMNRHKTTWKGGWRDIGGIRKFYRSRWEANYAYYLQWLKDHGNIIDWKHEPTTFWFDGVKRGTVSYLPDFWVKENNGDEAYHEVKGWMDDRSKTKIKRMAKYHPEVKLIVIDGKAYEEIKKKVGGLVPGWEP